MSLKIKITFTGLYTRYDSFSPKRQKISLIKCLINRTQKISSVKFLEKDLVNLKSIFLSNGYPGRLLDKLFDYNNNNKEKFIGPEKCPVYLKLPWLGDISENYFEKALKNTMEKTFSQQNSVAYFLLVLSYHLHLRILCLLSLQVA